jgi:Leucine-rich repeat (LRR) protein
VAGLTQMKQFNVSHNSLGSRRPQVGAVAPLPAGLFSRWQACEVINLCGNSLSSLPPLAGMPRLKKLLLSGNRLASLPESIESCGAEHDIITSYIISILASNTCAIPRPAAELACLCDLCAVMRLPLSVSAPWLWLQRSSKCWSAP